MSKLINGIDEEFLQYEFSLIIGNKLPVITYAGKNGASQGLVTIIPILERKLSGKYIFHIIRDEGTNPKLI